MYGEDYSFITDTDLDDILKRYTTSRTPPVSSDKTVGLSEAELDDILKRYETAAVTPAPPPVPAPPPTPAIPIPERAAFSPAIESERAGLGPMEHARRFGERLGKLPEQLTEFAGAAMPPGDPRFAPPETRRQIEEQFASPERTKAAHAGLEAASTITGPASAAIGDTLRAAGVPPSVALAGELIAAIPEGALMFGAIAKAAAAKEATSEITESAIKKAIEKQAPEAIERQLPEAIPEKIYGGRPIGKEMRGAKEELPVHAREKIEREPGKKLFEKKAKPDELESWATPEQKEYKRQYVEKHPVLYHGSDKAGAESLARGEGRGDIWFTPRRPQAEAYATGKGGKVFEIDTEKVPSPYFSDPEGLDKFGEVPDTLTVPSKRLKSAGLRPSEEKPSIEDFEKWRAEKRAQEPPKPEPKPKPKPEYPGPERRVIPREEAEKAWSKAARKQYREEHKPVPEKPVVPTEVEAKPPERMTPTEKVEKLSFDDDRFDREMNRIGSWGMKAPNEDFISYKMLEPTEGKFQIERTVAGNRDIIVGRGGSMFGSQDEAVQWARLNAKENWNKSAGWKPEGPPIEDVPKVKIHEPAPKPKKTAFDKAAERFTKELEKEKAARGVKPEKSKAEKMYGLQQERKPKGFGGIAGKEAKVATEKTIGDVDAALKKHLIPGRTEKGPGNYIKGIVKDSAPAEIRFDLEGGGVFHVRTEYLPEFKRRLKTLLKKQPHPGGKLPGPQAVTVKDLEPGEIIPLPKFQKAYEKALGEFEDFVRSDPRLKGARSMDDVVKRIKDLGEDFPDDQREYVQALFMEAQEAYDNLHVSKTGVRPWEEEATRKKYLEGKIETVTQRLSERLSSESGEAQILNDLVEGIGYVGKAAYNLAEAVTRAAKEKGRRGAKWFSESYIKSYEDSVRGMGQPGKQLANRIKNYRNFFEPRTGRALANYEEAIEGLTDLQWARVQKYLDEGVPIRDADLMVKAKSIRKELDEVVRVARKFGWDIGELENYFPHMGIKEEPVKASVIKSPIPGEKLMVHKRARSFNLERKRRDQMTAYRRDKEVLKEYFIDAYRQLGEIGFFGQRRFRLVKEYSDETKRLLRESGKIQREFNKTVRAGEPDMELKEAYKGLRREAMAARTVRKERIEKMTFDVSNQHIEALNLIGQMPTRGQQNRALEGFLRMTGNEGPRPAINQVLRFGRNVNAFLSLSTSAIPQASQFGHLVTETSLKAAQRAAREVASNPTQAYREALRSGSVMSSVMHEVQKAAGKSGGGFMWGLPTMDKMLRVVANSTAKHWVKELEEKGAKEALERIGIRGGRKATEKDIQRIGKMLADKTQFRADVQDLPLGFTDDVGKSMFQFMSFMYAHSKFMKNLVKEAAAGKPTKLAKFLAASKKLGKYGAVATVFGELAQDTRSLILRYDLGIKGDKEFEKSDWEEALMRAASTRRIPINHPFWRALQNISYVGGIGIYQSIFENLYHTRNPVIALTGPTVKRGIDVGYEVPKLAKPEKRGKAAARIGRKIIPTLPRRWSIDLLTPDAEEERKAIRRKKLMQQYQR